MAETTQFNFALTSDMLSSLAASDRVYAVAFGSTTNGGSNQMMSAGLIELYDGSGATGASITLTDGQFWSGTIYVIVDHGTTDLNSVILAEGDVATKAAANNFTYQLFEFTLSGSATDQGDISSVNSFALSSSVEVFYNNGTQSDTRGFLASTNDVLDAISAISPAAVTDNGGAKLAIGPAQDSAAWSPEAWDYYIGQLIADPAVLAQIQITAFFAGTASDPNQILSQYSLVYVAEDSFGSDYLWLVPDTSNGATNTDWIRIPVSDLAAVTNQLNHNIYGQIGQLEVHLGGKYGQVVMYDSFTPNNAAGTVVRELVAGFDAGFWGSAGTSANPLDTSTIDLNQNYSWNVSYAYGAALGAGTGDLTITQALAAGAQPGDIFYDPWARAILTNSNAYGYSYSDLVSFGGTNPQISLWDPARGPAGGNVESVTITIYSPDETPASGYVAPPASYFAGPYATPVTTYSGGLIFDFAFSTTGAAAANYAPNADTSITLRIFTGPSSFVDLAIAGPDVGGNPWGYYNITADGSGGWTLGTPTNPFTDGGFVLNDLPVPASGIGYYQLIFGAGESQTVYNLYFDSSAPGGAQFIMDHGVDPLFTAAGSTYQFAFAPGGQMLYDIDTFTAPPSASGSSAGATIRGTAGDDFVNAVLTVGDQSLAGSNSDSIYGLGGNDQLSGLAGNDLLDGGKGMDFLRGGDGDDTLVASGADSIFDSFDGGAGTDTLAFAGGRKVILAGFDAGTSSIEKLTAARAALFGTDSADLFDFGALVAVSGLAYVDGGLGDDTLRGSALADDLRGGRGNDLLDGRAGNDLLFGGAGSDTIVFADGYDSDIVKRFEPGVDRIDLSGVTTVSGFADLQMTQVGRSVVIDFGGGDTLTLGQATIAALSANHGDFLFG